MNLEGLIPIVGGMVVYLMGTGAIPPNPKDPAQLEAWRQKYGKLIKILGPVVILFGVLQLIGVFGN